MKKLKLFLLLFAAAVASVGFTSCNDDDDDAASIVGSWLYADSNEFHSEIMTFTADGLFIDQWEEKDFGLGSMTGTYIYDGGNTVTIAYDEGHLAIVPISISGDTMIFDEDEVFIRM